MNCPLCHGSNTPPFFEDAIREYLKCADCDLVFVPRVHRLGRTEEKAEYDKHENDPDDPGYRRFLSRLVEPLAQRLSPKRSGLDFGSGPGPTLPLMMAECGHACAIHDPFYDPHPEVFEQTWDFITATEVVEHLFEPGPELERLWAILKPGGTLGIMTKLVRDKDVKDAFSTWHYKNDPTHVCFFSRQTFEWLAKRLDAGLEIIGADVIVLSKRGKDP
jgi:hypothetical protein